MIKFALLALLLLPTAGPPAKVTYRITGTAVGTRDGAPIPYCRMQITDSAYGESSGRGQRNRQQPNEVDADAQGHFQFALDRPGAYVLTGSARDYRRQNFDEHEGFFSSIVLTPATPAAQVIFRMDRDAAIVGLVVDEAGEPVRQAQVVAEAPGQLADRPSRSGRGGRGLEGRPAGFAQTDDRGRYELSGLAPGAYRVRVSAQPWYAQAARFPRTTSASPSPDPSLDVIYPVTWYPGVDNDSAAEPIQLTGGEERQADFHLSPSPAIHLVIPRAEPPPDQAQGRPQRGAFILRVSPTGGMFNFNSTTNGSTQEFGGLSPGLYELHTISPDGIPDPAVRQIRIPPGTSGVIDLSTASLLTKVTLTLDGADAEAAGQIAFIDPATGRTVNPLSGMRRRQQEQSGDGEVAVYLAPGKWEVHVPPYASSYLTGLQATGASVNGDIVEISGQPVTLTLHMGTGRAQVSGIATLAGRPVEGAMVLLVPAALGEPGSVAEVQRDQTNTDGSFNLTGVVPGKYILLVIDRGWDVKWRDLATLATYLTYGVPVEVLPGTKVKRDVVVAPR